MGAVTVLRCLYIYPPSAEIEDCSILGMLIKHLDRTRDIEGVNIIAHLLSEITENCVLTF